MNTKGMKCSTNETIAKKTTTSKPRKHGIAVSVLITEHQGPAVTLMKHKELSILPWSQASTCRPLWTSAKFWLFVNWLSHSSVLTQREAPHSTTLLITVLLFCRMTAIRIERTRRRSGAWLGHLRDSPWWVFWVCHTRKKPWVWLRTCWKKRRHPGCLEVYRDSPGFGAPR